MQSSNEIFTADKKKNITYTFHQYQVLKVLTVGFHEHIYTYFMD
jgi:hypothetical protein